MRNAFLSKYTTAIRPFAKTALLVFVLLLSCSIVFGQSQKRKELEKQKSNLVKDIEYKNKLLEQTKKQKQSTLNDLVLINKKINERQQLITTIRTEINLLSDEIEENQALLESMHNDLEKLKEEYAELIRFAERNQNSYDKLMFVFAAKDFNQAYKRIKYLREYTEYRKRQAAAIKRLEKKLQEETDQLKKDRKQKEQLLTDLSSEKQKLAGEQEEQESLANNLKQKERELKKEIDKKQEEQLAIQKAIQRVIAEELRKSREANPKSKESEWSLTPEAKALADDFTSNKGQLPWPTKKGVITQSYGIKAHPVLSHLKVKNDGVAISTEEGSTARAVFDGEVSKVLIIPGAGKVVVIRHGDYLTAYGKLDDVFVTTGEKVTSKQDIGTIRTSQGKTEMEFQIRKGQKAETLDPAYWLYKAR
jgi:septal ring factor EnvC (AmiA/AmiB activator)